MQYGSFIPNFNKDNKNIKENKYPKEKKDQEKWNKFWDIVYPLKSTKKIYLFLIKKGPSFTEKLNKFIDLLANLLVLIAMTRLAYIFFLLIWELLGLPDIKFTGIL